MRARTIRGALAAAAFTAMLIAGCVQGQSYPLQAPPGGGRLLFDSLGKCAAEAGLARGPANPQFVDFMVDGATTVRFADQLGRFELVVLLGSDVPEPEQATKLAAGKAKGDELYACAMKLGPSAPPPTPTADATASGDATPAPSETAAPAGTTTAAPTTTAQPTVTTTASVSGSAAPKPGYPEPKLALPKCEVTTTACKYNGDCGKGTHCFSGFCVPDKAGCGCEFPLDCGGADLHCSDKMCWPNAIGAACDGGENVWTAACGANGHCYNKKCYKNERGAPCHSGRVSDGCPEGSRCVNDVCN